MIDIRCFATGTTCHTLGGAEEIALADSGAS
jgi:hypothetical protein